MKHHHHYYHTEFVQLTDAVSSQRPQVYYYLTLWDRDSVLRVEPVGTGVYDLSRVMPTSSSSDQNSKEKEDVTI